MRAIPTINTARLTLRAMRPQDFDRFAETWSRQDVVRFIGGTPWDRTRAWDSFLRNAGQWQMTGFGQWAIEPHGAGQIHGQVGFIRRSSGFGEDFDQWPEAGWMVHPDSQGQGLGVEATRAAHDWFDRVITGPLVCKIVPENAHSMSIAKMLGYVPMRKVTSSGEALQLMIRKSPPGGDQNILE